MQMQRPLLREGRPKLSTSARIPHSCDNSRGFIERQVHRLQPVLALVEMQDLVLANHAVVVADDPELDLDTNSRPKSLSQ